jgi:16S rRNA (guanine1207-N2)-methyltransferase
VAAPDLADALDAVLAGLRRGPDIEAPELRAWDAADRYLLDTAAPLIAAAPDRPVIVVDDTHGALTLGASALGATLVRGHSDSLIARRAIARNAERLSVVAEIEQHPLDALMTADARLALVRLPRSLDRLDALVRHLSATAHDELVLIAGNMVKHMTPTQNEVLRQGFARVDVSLARGKARLLTARGPRGLAPPEPARGHDPDTGLHIVALPGVFAGASLDIGTRAMLATFDALPPYGTAIDLACGSGVLASALARHDPAARVIATDVSEIAVRSARLTAVANRVAVETVLDDGVASQPDASADLIVLNPPFHVGAAVHTGIARRLFADAARVLTPGGELRVVWNSSLGYRPALEHLVGPTRQLARTPKFTVTASRRP